MPLTCETARRSVDRITCRWCGYRVQIGEPVFHDLDAGRIFCSAGCAEMDGVLPETDNTPQAAESRTDRLF